MKSAGIITFHCADNFGAVLQAYALQRSLKDMEINAEIIDFKPKKLTLPYNHSLDIINNIKNKGLVQAMKILVYKIYNYKYIDMRLKAFDRFRKNYLLLSNNTYYTSNELLINPPQYDFYITGSDQVWNPRFKKEIGDSYFLDFVDNNSSLKISYAASIAEEVEEELFKEYKDYLSTFDSISIREKSSLAFLQSLIENQIQVTLDPTLLLDKSKWKEISTSPEVKEKYILVYDLQSNSELIKIANKLSEEMNLKIISFSNKKLYNNMIDSFANRGPNEFLGLFESAEIILTNSFHGTVFSVLFNKPFYTIPHTTRGKRMVDLLQILDLNDRIIYKIEDIIKFNLNINYKKVNSILEEERKKSIRFLKDSMKKGNL